MSESFELSRVKDNLDFIKQTVDPKTYTCRPAPMAHPSAIFKQVTLNGNWKCYDPSLLVKERVPSSRGLVLFYPKDGVNSIYHMGIVPKGTTSTYDIVCVGIPSYAGDGNIPHDLDYSYIQPANSGLGAGCLFFQYNSALAIPRIESATTISFSPNLEEQFSRVRQYGAIAELWSATVSSGSIPFNGTCTASVISDTRDICQNATGEDCYSIVDLTQTARTPKESVQEVSIASGVITLQGCDIPSDYSAPNEAATDQVNGGWQDFTPQLRNVLLDEIAFGAGSNFTQGGPYNLSSIWITPWNVDCGNANGSASPILGMPSVTAEGIIPRFNSDRLTEMGFLDIDFEFPCHLSAFGDLQDPGNCTFHLTTAATHWFAYVKDTKTGEIGYNTINEAQFDTVSADAFASVASTQNTTITKNTGKIVPVKTLRMHSRIQNQVGERGGLKQLGKYIGTRIDVFIGIGGATGFIPASGNALPQLEVHHDQLKLQVRARRIYETGRTGPCHILRYDRVGADQNIQFKGVLNCECVAKGQLAPYVQDSIMNTQMTADTNIYPLVYALYNGKTPFKMSWSRDQWLAFKETVENMDPQQLLEYANNDGHVAAAASAAGIFGSLGRALGSVGGALIGDPALGGELGGFVGGLADSATHARGQFGRINESVTRGAGQFGYTQARGQFGY